MKLAFIFLAVLSSAYGYNILCIQNVPSKSHFHLMKGLVDPLLEAGHQVTWITTYPGTKPVQNLTYIDVSHLQALVDYIDMSDNQGNGIVMVREFAWNISRGALETPAVRNVLLKDRFDAVITEWFFSDVDAGFAAVLQAPWIQLSGMVFHLHLEHLVDTVRSVPVIPSQGNDFEMPMTLWQRIKNTISFLFFTYYNTLDQTPRKNYERYFTPIAEARGVPLPPFSEALHNISILLVNQHSSFAPAQSTPPNVVDIAGYHIDENVPQLPKDLQQLLDSSPQGVVYFSMGSVLKSAAQFPEQTKKDLISMFAAMPYTVLWKFEEELKDLPKNVHIRPWMPQSSILSHPNVKAFITHGGLLSTLESLHFGVPIIAIPVFGDQPGNARRSVRAGHALMVELNPTELAGKLRIALNEMLNNDKYYNRAKYISKLFRNRPVSNKKLIQHYVELAIESKGAYHLRSKSLLYSWYQLWMLDQLALLVLALYVILRVLKKIASLFSKKENVARGKKEKRN